MLPVSTVWLVPLFTLTLVQAPQSDTPAKPVKQNADTKLSNAVNELRIERNRAEAYVLRAKLAPAPVPGEARKLYDEARALYNAYIETFLDSIRKKSKADLSQSLKPAANAASKFKEYVDGNTKAMGVGWLIPLGKAIFDAIVTAKSEADKRSETERAALADEWAKTLPWRAWDAIK